MGTIQEVRTDADLEAWRQVRIAVLPHERADTVEQMRATTRPSRLLLLARDDGDVVGSALSDKSDMAGHASVTVRVIPEARRRGIGTALLRALNTHTVTLGFPVAVANADDEGSAAFAERFGFHEIDRQIEQVRTVGDEPSPAAPEGVTIVSVADRPALWSVAYESVAVEAFQDMAIVSPVSESAEEWTREWITKPEAMFLALSRDEVIACAGLLLTRMSRTVPRTPWPPYAGIGGDAVSRRHSSAPRSRGPRPTGSARFTPGRRSATRTCAG